MFTSLRWSRPFKAAYRPVRMKAPIRTGTKDSNMERKHEERVKT